MKTICAVTLLLMFLHFFLQTANAQTDEPADPLIAAVQAADDSRIATMRAPDRGKLDAIFSDELRYAHSNGVVDTKSSFIEVLDSGKSRYLGYEHEERNISIPAPGIAIISGRARIRTESAAGRMDNVLSYLAVWREEKGEWRFLAWQSCRLPAVTNP